MAWKPIRIAPIFERVLVAGWQKKTPTVAGYWWWYEDMTDGKGVPIEHPTALLWMPEPELPTWKPE